MNVGTLQYDIWNSSYRYDNEPTVQDTWRRVAKYLASVERDSVYWEEKFYNNLADYKTTLGGRILSNAGTRFSGTSLMNCFVLGPRLEDVDSLECIYTDLKEQALTLKSEGGWGYNFSHIRPRTAFINGVGAESPGSVSFMELYDMSSRIITSGSGKKKKHATTKEKIRKGAMMGIIEIWHPDAIEFITAKQTPNRLTKFNLSVGLNDDFMNAVIEGKDWNFIFPDINHEAYKVNKWNGDIRKWIESGYPVVIYDTRPAKDIWELIMTSTYNRNEPGIVFLDAANRMNNLWKTERIIATNPCGEITLPDGGVCLLGSINLVHFINGRDWDYEKLKEIIPVQVRMMDNVNDLSHVPLQIQKKNMIQKRRIGMGLLGYGSALMIMGIRYGSDEAIAITENLMSFIANQAYQASAILAKEKGPFKLYNSDEIYYSKFINRLDPETRVMVEKYGLRNSHLLAIAPTGQTSIYAGMVSGGCEPVMYLEYDRWVIQDRPPEGMISPAFWEGKFHETEHFKFDKVADVDVLRGIGEWSDYMIDKDRGLVKRNTVMDYAWQVIKDSVKGDEPFLDTINQLGPDDHLKTLHVMAKYIDQAISKTINLPNDYPYEYFKNIYLEAWKANIKGLTTYRAGTMTAVISAKEEKEKDWINGEEIVTDHIKLPDNFDSRGTTLRSYDHGSKKKWYVFANFFSGTNRPFALFVVTNHSEPKVIVSDTLDKLFKLALDKGIPEKYIEDTRDKCKIQNGATQICRAISLNLRHGVLIKNIVACLEQVEVPLGSFVQQIRKYLSSYIRDGESTSGVCPQCGNTKLVFIEGCKACKCGWRACG